MLCVQTAQAKCQVTEQQAQLVAATHARDHLASTLAANKEQLAAADHTVHYFEGELQLMRASPGGTADEVIRRENDRLRRENAELQVQVGSAAQVHCVSCQRR